MKDRDFVRAAAAGRNEVWRYLLSFLVVLIGVGVQVVFIGIAEFVNRGGIDAALQSFMLPHWRWGESYDQVAMTSAAIYLASLFLWGLIALLAVKIIHRRPAKTVFIGRTGFRWRLFWESLASVVVLCLAFGAIDWLVRDGDLLMATDFEAFLHYLPMLLALVPLQVFGEEVLFRGYLLQGVAWFSRRPWVRLLVPSVTFFAMHLGNEEMTKGGTYYVVGYVVVAFYFTWLTLRTDGLECSMGMHLGMNFVAFIFISEVNNTFAMPTLYFDRQPEPATMLAVLVAVTAGHYYWLVHRTLNRVERDKGSAGPWG